MIVPEGSASAFADHDWDDDDYRPHHHRKVKHVVVHHVYEQPQVVYQEPRVIYRDRPVIYQEPAPRYPERVGYRSGPLVSDRLVGQTLGAVTGGLLANRIGKGNGRIVATAAGAAIGAVVGGRIADPSY